MKKSFTGFRMAAEQSLPTEYRGGDPASTECSTRPTLSLRDEPSWHRVVFLPSVGVRPCSPAPDLTFSCERKRPLFRIQGAMPSYAGHAHRRRQGGMGHDLLRPGLAVPGVGCTETAVSSITEWCDGSQRRDCTNWRWLERHLGDLPQIRRKDDD